MWLPTWKIFSITAILMFLITIEILPFYFGCCFLEITFLEFMKFLGFRDLLMHFPLWNHGISLNYMKF